MKTPTDEQLNLAMCEWMGWKVTTASCGIPPTPTKMSKVEGYDLLPNYLSDDSPRRLLNEAEARLTDEQHKEFRRNLKYICGTGATTEAELSAFLRARCSATARQRVIAILQTVKPELFC